MSLDINQILEKIKSHRNFDQIGLSKINTPVTIDFYMKWLNENHYGSMAYLKDHAAVKADPRRLDSNLNTVISFTHAYYPAPFPSAIDLPTKVALYAQNNDYHFWFKEKLNQAIEDLKAAFPNDIFLAYVDSGPILEKDWAYQSGLGWFGKNTCLIHPKKGSLFFIAEILTSLKIEETSSKKTVHDFCGTCTACIDACPTNAIKHPRHIKADDCISYLTIESKTTPPIDLRQKIGDWFFGCDICQTVCPWNIKLHKTFDYKIDSKAEIDFFKDILISSNKQLQKKFYGSPLHRSAGFGLKRNALIVIANKKITALRNEVLLLIQDKKLGELAQWCLNQLTE